MSDVAIRVENLSKRYRIGARQAGYSTIRETVTDLAVAPVRRLRRLGQPTPPEETIWALKDVSFEVKQGEVLGIIGPNGSGKTTLLKVLSRITEPTEGQAGIHGRVGSLLEVGTGFHPELTGRENIYLNGAILGMKRTEIETKFDEIVDFAEIEKFLDTPVKRYSSGMYVRLAFAVAAHLEPEILLVDEVLAVGDAAFQKKCLGKMGDVAEEGRTVLFVSHNMGAVQNLCAESILLEGGRMLMRGHTHSTISTYLQRDIQQQRPDDLTLRKDRKGSGMIRWKSVSFHRQGRGTTSTFLSGDHLTIRLRYTASQQLPDRDRILVGISIKDMYDQVLFLCSNELTGEIGRGWPKNGEVICVIPRLPLSAGSYKANVYVAINGVVADWIVDAASFDVERGDFFGTGRMPIPSHERFLVPHSWTVGHKEDLSEGG